MTDELRKTMFDLVESMIDEGLIVHQKKRRIRTAFVKMLDKMRGKVFIPASVEVGDCLICVIKEDKPHLFKMSGEVALLGSLNIAALTQEQADRVGAIMMENANDRL